MSKTKELSVLLETLKRECGREDMRDWERRIVVALLSEAYELGKAAGMKLRGK